MTVHLFFVLRHYNSLNKPNKVEIKLPNVFRYYHTVFFYYFKLVFAYC